MNPAICAGALLNRSSFFHFLQYNLKPEGILFGLCCYIRQYRFGAHPAYCIYFLAVKFERLVVYAGKYGIIFPFGEAALFVMRFIDEMKLLG